MSESIQVKGGKAVAGAVGSGFSSNEATAGHRGASRIVFLRHGQTDFNVQRRFQGIVDRPLNEVGRGQARAAAEVLASRIVSPSEQIGVSVGPVEDLPGVKIMSSPLLRAHETAQILAAAFAKAGLSPDGPHVDERLIERCYGEFEGLTVDEISTDFLPFLQEWRRTGESEAAGIEPSNECGRRMEEATVEAAATCPDGATLVVVSHGSAITRALVTFMGLDPLTFDALKGLDNCHWSELVFAGGGGSGASGDGSWRLAAHNIGAREDVLGA